MKILWCLPAMMLCCAMLQAQTKPKTTPKTTTAKKTAVASKGKTTKTVKKKTTTGRPEDDELICYEDGPCTFDIHKGDTLVYDVSASGKQYKFMVVPQKFNAATVADFNWLIADANGVRNGHVNVATKALNSSKRYLTNFPPGELKLTDASALWLSAGNFSEATKKETAISFDNGAPESFSSPEADAAIADISYKGKPTSLDGFILQNKEDGQPDRKELWILNISSNLLMLRYDSPGMTMQLKEVRAKK